MNQFKITKRDGRRIIEDEFGQRFNSENIAKAIETVKYATDLDLWEKQDIIKRLNKK